MKHYLHLRTQSIAWFLLAASGAALPAFAQTPAPAAASANERSSAYYHASLAHIDEQLAGATGDQAYVTQAIEEYKLALNADPNSPQLNTGLAEVYFRSGHIREAVETAKAQIKKDPNNLEAHKLLGHIYLRTLNGSTNNGDATGGGAAAQTLDLAIAEFEKIVTLEPKAAENHVLLGQLYSAKHDEAKAAEQLKLAQSLEPASEDVLLNLAKTYADKSDYQHSAAVLESLPPDNRSIRLNMLLGATYDQLKDTKKAIIAYRLAEKADPGDPEVLFPLAQDLEKDNQLDAALKMFQQIDEADPDNVAVLVQISEIERRQAKYQQALDTIEKAKKKDPDSLEVGYNEGLLLDVLGRYDESIDVYKHMVDLTSHANGAYTDEEKSNRSVFLERLAAVYRERNKSTNAAAIFQQMILLGGDFAKRGYIGEIETYRDAKMSDQAIATAKQAVVDFPQDRELKLALAWELAYNGKTDEGVTIANSLITHSDKDQEVYLQLSDIYARDHRWKEAEDTLTKAEPFATKPQQRALIFFQRGAFAERQKHLEQAEQFFVKSLELDPENPSTLNYLGYMLADKTTKYVEALKYVRKAVEIDPMNGAFLDSLGWAYFKLGEYEPAEENLRHAVDRDANDPTVHDHLGDLYEKTGRIQMAAAQWELSLAAYAKTPSSDTEPGEVERVQKKLNSVKAKLAQQIQP